MNWREQVAAIAERTGQPKSTVDRAIRGLVDRVRDELVEGREVRVPGLGTFDSRWYDGGVVRSPETGQRIPFDGRHVARFRASSKLKASLRDRAPQLLRDPAHRKAWRVAAALVGDLDLYHGGTAPRIAPQADDDQLERSCRSALGEAWFKARETWEASIPSEVRAERDHLLDAARRAWAGMT